MSCTPAPRFFGELCSDSIAEQAHDINRAHQRLNYREKPVWADADSDGTCWQAAMLPGRHNTLRIDSHVKVEHTFRVIKLQFGVKRFRCQGQPENPVRIATLFALSNVWMARHRLLGAQA